MGKIIRFDPKRRRGGQRRWTRAQDYGGDGAGGGQPPRKRPPERGKGGRAQPASTWGEAFRATRPILLLIALVTLAVIWRQPMLLGAPDFLSTDPQVIDAQWTRCGELRSRHCVIDGDTFRIGSRSYRVLGFDTPESGEGARCEAEAVLADRATQALTDWMNAGAFTMQGRWDEPTDRYGRALRELYRTEGGTRQWVGDTMVGAGLARRYYGGARDGWC